MEGEEGARETYGVAGNPSEVGDKAGGGKAYGVAENPRGYHQRVRGGVELPQGIGTPGVDELLQGYETPIVATKGAVVMGYNVRGRGGDGNPPHHLSNQGERSRRRR